MKLKSEKKKSYALYFRELDFNNIGTTFCLMQLLIKMQYVKLSNKFIAIF